MSTIDSIFSIVIFHICMSLFESTLLNFCKPQSKLDQVDEIKCNAINTFCQNKTEGIGSKSNVSICENEEFYTFFRVAVVN